MDYTSLLLLLSFFLSLIYVFTISGRRNPRLPPGPYPYPIIGNLLKLGDLPHHSMAVLSKHYGPLMSLKLGTKTAIVVSSPEIAKDFFLTHDQAFAGRSVPATLRHVEHEKYSLVFLPAEHQWRKLRRISREYLFSVQRLEASKQLRGEKVRELVEHVHRCCETEKAINIGEAMFTTSLNVLSNFIFSLDMSQYDSVSSQEFKDAVWNLMEVSGKPNLVDFFPILKPFDLQGLLRQADTHFTKIMNIFGNVITQRIKSRSIDDVSSKKNDILDLLLNLDQEGDSVFSQSDMKHLFVDLFSAGTDTTSSTMEWVMTELIRNPKKMEIARQELVKHLKSNDGIIEEEDIVQLPYLQAVIKETLRLHPPAPLLVPHAAVQDVEVRGFIVPKDAQIFCNIWAMGRDPNIWPDPEIFMPERFLDIKVDYKGQDFKFIPFGAGRRICPGISVAHRMLHLVLGSLILKFDWKLEGNMRPQDINMEDKFGVTVQRKVPLMAIPIKL